MHLTTYLTFLQRTEETLCRGYRLVSDGHAADADVHYASAGFARQCAAHAEALAPVLARPGLPTEPEPQRLHVPEPSSHRPGAAGRLRDVLDLYQLASLVEITWSLVRQAAQGARDRDLIDIVDGCAPQTTAQLAWLRMHLTSTAAQTLLVAT
jgi:hypothetical protein